MKFYTNREVQKKEYDVVVLGGGIAGLFMSLELPENMRVALLTKESVEVSNSVLAQGGIAVSFGENDSPASHFEDTIKAGAGLCDENAVNTLVTEAQECILSMCEKYHVEFDKDENGKIILSREAAHACPRIIHSKDKTGHDVCQTLLENVNRRENIDIYENTVAIELLKADGKCIGVEAVQRDNGLAADEEQAVINDEVFIGKDVADRAPQTGSVIVFQASAVVCASGGYGQLFKYTSNPNVTTGDGVVMAGRIGAKLENIEFVQFHPTALIGKKEECRFLISEALRGAGAILRNVNGERFMPKYHEAAELAARDIVSRAIDAEMNETKGECVYLDITQYDAEYLQERFPTIYNECMRNGIDISKDYIPVAPIAHFCMGGIKVDLDGCSTVPGLFACGEAACTGVHGANRLASNSLLEGLVFGRRAARKIALDFGGYYEKNGAEVQEDFVVSDKSQLAGDGLTVKDCNKVRSIIKSIMMQKVGIVRNGKDMADAFAEIKVYKNDFEKRILRTADGQFVFDSLKEIEVYNMLELAELLIEAAMDRKENRGGHYRSDCV